MNKKTSTKDKEIILVIRDLQKMISNAESQEVVKVIKQARNALIKIYADNDREEIKELMKDIPLVEEEILEIIGEKKKEVKKWHFRNTYKK